MSFLEDDIGSDLDVENTIDQEISSYRDSKKLSKDEIMTEFKELRKLISSNMGFLEKALKKIDILEMSINLLDQDKLKKKSVRNDKIGNKNIIDIILIKKDVDVPADYENVLLITEENMGLSVFMPTEEVLRICNEILETPDGTKIYTNNCIETGKYGVLNDSGDWILMESSETTTSSTTMLD